ncbi:MAG: PH domain-containing protein [Saprospiraceae bacterium]|nr:PH domain-containing protein [Saprospiraceae bacterium]
MKRSDLHERQRQSFYAIIFILLKFVRNFIRQLWPVLVVVLVGQSDNIRFFAIGLTILIGIISFASALISYYKFFFFIEGDQLHIEKGLLRRTRLNLPFDRIQTIDFEQSILHQAFKVVRVKVDSAGTKTSEIAFDALEIDRASQLRDYILAQKEEAGQEQAAEAVADEPAEVILHLQPGDLLKIGISQNHFRTAGIIFAAAWALLENIDQVLEQDLFEQVQEEAAMLLQGSLIVVLIAIPLFLFVSFLFTLVRTIIVYFDLRFMKTRHGFKLVAGLLTRKEKSAQRNKIQIIAWRDNPVQRLFGIFRLNLYQASSDDVIGSKSIAVPGCFKTHVDETITNVFPGALEAPYEIHGIHPLARFRFVLFFGLVPCLVATGLAWLVREQLVWWIWLYLPFSVWMAILYHRKRKLHLHQDFVISAKGIFGNSYKLMEIYKIQAVKLSQSFYQWRKDLATVTMYTASGDLSIPFIPYEKANQLRDYILYRVEQDGRDWM